MSKLDIPANINFALYESPLQRIIGEAVETRIKQEENAAMAHITETIGYKVDKTELIRALNYDRDQYAKGYADGLNADRWISVKDQLPEVGEYDGDVAKYYLVQNEYGDMMVARYTHSGYWEQIYQLKPIADEIVAWQPLPEPAKVGDEE